MKYTNFSIVDLANAIRERQLNEFDMVIIVDGARGSGKSNLIWNVCKRMGNFNPYEDIVFSRKDLKENLKRKYSLIFADEMINAAHNRDFYEKEQKVLVKILNMYRDNHNLLIGAVPFFYDLDPQFRKFVKMRITVIRRGLAVIQTQKRSLYLNDPWETDYNKKIEKKADGRKLQYTKLSTFQGYMQFSKMTPKDDEVYRRLKEQKRNKLMEENESDEDKNDPKQQGYETLYKRLLNGNLRGREIEVFALALGLNKVTVMQHLQKMLLKDGHEPKLRPLLIPN